MWDSNKFTVTASELFFCNHTALWTTTCYSSPPIQIQRSFTVSYLTNNCGLSLQGALKASKRLRLNTPHKPDSVISFFKTHGFSNDQIQTIIRRDPQMIVYNPIKSILPKIQFLSSKGASPQDIVAAIIGQIPMGC